MYQQQDPHRPCAGGFGFGNYKASHHQQQDPHRPCAGGFGFDNYKASHPSNKTPTGLVPVDSGLVTMKPLYTPENTSAAYQLNWSLTLFWRSNPISDQAWLVNLQQATEPDGVRIIKHRISSRNTSQFFISTQPHVAPAEMVRRVKGRLQHLLRTTMPSVFQRNYCLRSVGTSTRNVVEDYVANQLGHHEMADPAVQRRFARFQRTYTAVELSEPAFNSHGKYWYNLHLVFCNTERWMEIREDVLETLSETIEQTAMKHEYRLSRAALLADHVHLTMGCVVTQSPEEVAMGFLNNCAFARGMKPEFQFSYFVGTIGEYDRGAVT